MVCHFTLRFSIFPISRENFFVLIRVFSSGEMMNGEIHFLATEKMNGDLSLTLILVTKDEQIWKIQSKHY